jgi:hypothetical protein
VFVRTLSLASVRQSFQFKLFGCKRLRHLHRTIDVSSEIWNHSVALHRRYYRLFSATSGLARSQDFDPFCLFETLSLKAMHQLWGRKVGDLGFADFLLKAEWMAKKLVRDLVKIDRWEPTTKRCHRCGYRQDMPLTMRTFECGGCGNVEDRDLNAALNIWEAGRRLEVGRHQ